MQHPDFAVLTVSWELALPADGYADNTVKAYQNALRSLAHWLAEHHPQVGPRRAGSTAHPGLAGRGPPAPLQQHHPRMVRRRPALLPLAPERG